MAKKSFLLIIALSFLIIGASCSNQTVTPTPGPVIPTPSQPDQVNPPPIASNEAVVIQGFAFVPQILKVKVGTTVVWTNNDSAPHDIKSTLFLSPRLSQGQTFQYTFSQIGSYDYSCGIHPSMQGKIIVE